MIRKIWDNNRALIRKDLQEVRGYSKGIDRFLFLLAVLFCLAAIYYSDIAITGPFGCIFWDSLFDGQPLSFYRNALQSGIAVEGAVYDIGAYVFFAIWDLPVWIIYKETGCSLTSMGFLYWYRLLPTLFLFLDALELRKLAASLGYDDRTSVFASILFLLSSCAFFPVFVAVQYDVIPVFFMLRGIRAWYRHDEKRFLVDFAISLTVKPFTLLVLLLLVLWRDRNVWKIIIRLFLSCLPMILCKLIYSLDPTYRQTVSGFLGNKLSQVFSYAIPGGFGNISLLIICFAVIYLYAYLKGKDRENSKDREDQKNDLRPMLLCFALFASYLCFGEMFPYWTMYLAPFAVLSVLAGLTPDNRNRQLLVDFIWNGCVLVLMIFKYYWVYGGDHTFAYLILRPFCGSVLAGNGGTTVAGILRRTGLEAMTPALSAVLLVCLSEILLCAFRHAGERVSVPADHGIRIQLRIRLLVILGFLCLTLAALAITVLGL